ncbi:MAG: GDP-mannose 4,6-dehydratase [Zymomonas mobilis subsp. pomaceae]|uniref:NAD-dependent epimerase/dehydratase n=1 Tax=Zymomonas mobilis subsp. pomaceae (strain ATCC 29192 / DSM 22645 / JCM 10191 / CCUG 17912 / NBRC 13757 / NCIMB 11200 / NRRL B-4491 / Barker I) TaxID=579138 RepID=F8EUL4_ZYMMT|nr:GDP-mannose 4,6-dehydratase [Zymomonas mobilis]AEI37230.1 NAD-dependent epimerase/dehydratase [Zymomonas mobilis subsp. pomaceae ATCC 29192]MDX5948600.1 GDP-mannose 4,6-dehydratase [Zymomonas mobilis subsp. pomaceae]GEB88406.1 NAD-dependent epimerase [Zymomonas mobilis subsp. pomaceae]
MAILITGVAGFIGSYTAKALLEKGKKVIGIDNLNNYYDPALKKARLLQLDKITSGSFQFYKADFSEAQRLNEILKEHDFDQIIHFGAQAGVRYSLINPKAYGESNLMGHLNILELARHRAIAHMVYASSSSVYGNRSLLPFKVESQPDYPVSLYAATKRAGEMMSESYAYLYRMPLTGLRFFTVYGPWGRPDMAMWIFTQSILNHQPIMLFNHGDMQRDFTYIDDIVSGVLGVLAHPPVDDGKEKAGGSINPHSLYNIGNNRPEKLQDMVKLLEQACQRKAIKELRPMQAGDVYATYADITAIKQDIGFEPQTSLKDGIPRFVEWFCHYHDRI